MKRISPYSWLPRFAAPACSSSRHRTAAATTRPGSGSDIDRQRRPVGPGCSASAWSTTTPRSRIAALRLTGDLPTMDEINAVANARRRRGEEDRVRGADHRVHGSARRSRSRCSTSGATRSSMGETADARHRAGVRRRARRSRTARTWTCSRGDRQLPDVRRGRPARSRRPTAPNGGPQAGVLDQPGVMTQFFSNFAFRRVALGPGDVRLHEVPGRGRDDAADVGGAAPYTGVWPFTVDRRPDERRRSRRTSRTRRRSSARTATRRSTTSRRCSRTTT